MLKSVIPVVLAAAGISSAVAEEGALKTLIGFEFGTAYHLYNDQRFDGITTTFALAYQVNSRIAAGVYHEQGHIHGEENGTDASIDISVNQFRLGTTVGAADSGAHRVGIKFGFGSASYSGDIDTSELVADLEIDYSPIVSRQGPVVGALTIVAAYRYAPLDNVAIGGFTDTIDDLGGFILGLAAGLYF